MNKTEYLKALGRALVSRGMSKETAEYHMRVLSMSVSERDLVGRKDEEISKEIDHLADSITLILKSENDKEMKEDGPSQSSAAVSGTQVGVLPEYISPDSVVPVDFDAENVPRGDEIDELVGKSKARRLREEKPIQPTSGAIAGARGKVAGLVALYAFLIILRIVCVLLLIAVTIAGVALFALGFIYGVTQFFSFRGAALYEIGLSLIIGGVSLALGVVIYNLVGNFIPRAQKWIKKRIRSLRSRIADAKSRYDGRRKES